ncbi:hypothetical protein DIPPA_55413 [Diplonema papillatum]|nr:hypothetical protein DIPPA_55413 [Diplonema papillatum]
MTSPETLIPKSMSGGHSVRVSADRLLNSEQKVHGVFELREKAILFVIHDKSVFTLFKSTSKVNGFLAPAELVSVQYQGNLLLLRTDESNEDWMIRLQPDAASTHVTAEEVVAEIQRFCHKYAASRGDRELVVGTRIDANDCDLSVKVKNVRQKFANFIQSQPQANRPGSGFSSPATAPAASPPCSPTGSPHSFRRQSLPSPDIDMSAVNLASSVTTPSPTRTPEQKSRNMRHANGLASSSRASPTRKGSSEPASRPSLVDGEATLDPIVTRRTSVPRVPFTRAHSPPLSPLAGSNKRSSKKADDTFWNMYMDTLDSSLKKKDILDSSLKKKHSG